MQQPLTAAHSSPASAQLLLVYTGQSQLDGAQALYVFAFVHAIFDDLITSTKLLVTGKLVPSGNLMRQALEGMAVAVLCSSRKLLLIPINRKKAGSVQVKYWELVETIDKRVESNKALAHLELNRTQLSVRQDAIDELKRGIKNLSRVLPNLIDLVITHLNAPL